MERNNVQKKSRQLLQNKSCSGCRFFYYILRARVKILPAQANQEIQDLQNQASAGNTKADQAIEKVSELENDGKLTSEEASTLKNAIADTKVDAAAANQDISVTMPQEDAAIQQQAAQLAASAETLQTASTGFSQATVQMKQVADACAEMQNMDLSGTVRQL